MPRSDIARPCTEADKGHTLEATKWKRQLGSNKMERQLGRGKMEATTWKREIGQGRRRRAHITLQYI